MLRSLYTYTAGKHLIIHLLKEVQNVMIKVI